jgi:hypothetical protein
MREKESKMRSLALALIATWALVGVSFAAQRTQTYSGEIMDSTCAAMGSHEVMMKSNSNMKTPKDCTIACVQHGAKYVLFDAGTMTVYQLDDQKKPVPFAGAKVVVTGTLDPAMKMIHVANIKAES